MNKNNEITHVKIFHELGVALTWKVADDMCEISSSPGLCWWDSHTAILADPASALPWECSLLCQPTCPHWQPSHLAVFQPDLGFVAGV